MKRFFRVVLYVVVVVLFNIPFVATVLTSLKTTAQISASPPLLFFSPTLQNFVDILTSPKLDFLKYLSNSFFLSILGTFLAIILALPAAYAMVRNNVGKSFLLPFVTNLRSVPLIIFAIPFYFMFQTVGLFDSTIGLAAIACLINLPLSLIIFVGFFQDLPIELEEAAFIDGANVRQVMLKIVLPLSATILVSVAILSFIYSWNEFLFGLILTTRKATPVTVGATFFITSYGVQWGKTAAAITLSVLPPVMIGVFSFRFLIRALLAGAVKG